MNTHPMEPWYPVFRKLDEDVEGPASGSVGFAAFELDFERALMRQLGPFFEMLAPLRLTPENIISSVQEKARGAYYLILGDRVMYIGKSDAKAGLQQRLLRHYKTLKRRRGIDWSEMKFKAVKVASLAALDTESLLLRLFQMRGALEGSALRPDWNLSGFGSNDPGVERDTQRVSVFDQKFPLDLDAVISLETVPEFGSSESLQTYLDWLRKELKFIFRVQKKGVPKELRLNNCTVVAQDMLASLRLKDLLLRIHEALPAGWVLTVLRGKVVLYLDDKRPYKSPLWQLKAGYPPEAEPNYELGDVGTPQDDELSADELEAEDI